MGYVMSAIQRFLNEENEFFGNIIKDYMNKNKLSEEDMKRNGICEVNRHEKIYKYKNDIILCIKQDAEIKIVEGYRLKSVVKYYSYKDIENKNK